MPIYLLFIQNMDRDYALQDVMYMAYHYPSTQFADGMHLTLYIFDDYYECNAFGVRLRYNNPLRTGTYIYMDNPDYVHEGCRFC